MTGHATTIFAAVGWYPDPVPTVVFCHCISFDLSALHLVAAPVALFDGTLHHGVVIHFALLTSLLDGLAHRNC